MKTTALLPAAKKALIATTAFIVLFVLLSDIAIVASTPKGSQAHDLAVASPIICLIMAALWILNEYQLGTFEKKEDAKDVSNAGEAEEKSTSDEEESAEMTPPSIRILQKEVA